MTASLNAWIDRVATTFVMVTMLAALPLAAIMFIAPSL